MKRDERDEADRVRDDVIKWQRRALLACGFIIGALALRVAFTEPAVLQLVHTLTGAP